MCSSDDCSANGAISAARSDNYNLVQDGFDIGYALDRMRYVSLLQ
jgi:hypothetical protein